MLIFLHNLQLADQITDVPQEFDLWRVGLELFRHFFPYCAAYTRCQAHQKVKKRDVVLALALSQAKTSINTHLLFYFITSKLFKT